MDVTLRQNKIKMASRYSWSVQQNKPCTSLNMPLPLLKLYHIKPTQSWMATKTMLKDWKKILASFSIFFQKAQLMYCNLWLWRYVQVHYTLFSLKRRLGGYPYFTLTFTTIYHRREVQYFPTKTPQFGSLAPNRSFLLQLFISNY